MVEKKPADAERLAHAAEQLVAAVATLDKDTGGQLVALAKKSRTNRYLITGVIALGMIELTLIVWLVIGHTQWTRNTERIDALTHRLDIAQTETRQRVLCPLYQLFLDSKSAAGRKASPDPERYDYAFEVIQDGYDTLKCSQFINDPD